MVENYSWVGNWSSKRALLSPSRTAVFDNTTRISYSFLDMDHNANKLANYLESINISKGDRVGVFTKNRIENIDLFNATGKTGAILVPFNVRLSTPEIIALISLTKPKILFYDSSLKAKIPDVEKAHPDMQLFFLDDKENKDYQSRISTFSNQFTRKCEINFDDPHIILFTGGTTGLPKGAILSHKLIFWNSVNTITSWGLRPDDIQPLLFPLYHTGGWNVLFIPFYHIGAQTILMGDFDPHETLHVISKHNCSVVIGVPTIYQMVSESDIFKTATFDSVRVFISGGAACPLAIMEKYWGKNKPFKMGYGLTEVGPNNFYLPEDKIKEKPLSVGFPVFHCDMKIVDDEGKIVAVNEVGELCLKGPHRFSGYWNNEEETKRTIDSDGWVHTGDLAKQDEEGFYYIVDRKKDMFISGGENVFPVEVEEVIYKHPNVLEVAVFGVTDEKWGEVGVAAIAPKQNLTVSEQEIKNFLQDKLARFKQPKYYVFYKELPKSAAGKILRREVKKEFKLK